MQEMRSMQQEQEGRREGGGGSLVEVSRGTWAWQGRAAQARTMQGSKSWGGGGQSLAANHQPTAGLLDSVASWLMGSKIDW